MYNEVADLNSRSGEAILSLTRLMRYSVESTRNELNTVEKELEAIEEYLKLQQLRFGDRLALKYSRHGRLLFFSVPSLVLISLVENAFKYGIQDDPADPIELDVRVDSSQLTFRCRNKKRLYFTDKETTAVGLTNIRRRLEIAFPDHFELKIKDSTDYFEVNLEISWIGE
ncbi:MAG: histidine kinase [Leadbetterella sp.]|nr:histidine kinase [Leadbetterella sp.]